jgi:hypothetical protein
MGFVAVAGQQQAPAGMHIPGDSKQAHGAILARRCRIGPPLRSREGDDVDAKVTSVNFAQISNIETKQQLVDKA